MEAQIDKKKNAANESGKKVSYPKITTKSQTRKSAVGSLVIGLVLALGALGFVYWDYREQVKFYNIFERGSGLDFKTGKMIPNYQPPPFQYRFDRMGFLPFVIIFGAVSLLMLLLAASDFRKLAKMVETSEMLTADAEREKIKNSPKIKRARRINLVLNILPCSFSSRAVYRGLRSRRKSFRRLYSRCRRYRWFGLLFCAALDVEAKLKFKSEKGSLKQCFF